LQLAANTGQAITILQDIDGIEGKYVFVNELWPRITGYSEAELLKMSAFDLISPEYLNIERRKYRSIITGKTIPKMMEASVIAKSGATIPVEINLAPTTYAGRPGALLQIRDIQERKQLEYDLRFERDQYRGLLKICRLLYGRATVRNARK
jgi:PAS domain S-box-containing protein